MEISVCLQSTKGKGALGSSEVDILVQNLQRPHQSRKCHRSSAHVGGGGGRKEGGRKNKTCLI